MHIPFDSVVRDVIKLKIVRNLNGNIINLELFSFTQLILKKFHEIFSSTHMNELHVG